MRTDVWINPLLLRTITRDSCFTEIRFPVGTTRSERSTAGPVPSPVAGPRRGTGLRLSYAENAALAGDSAREPIGPAPPSCDTPAPTRLLAAGPGARGLDEMLSGPERCR